LGFFTLIVAQLFGARDVLTLVIEQSDEGWWIGHAYPVPVDLTEQPRTILTTAALVYGQLQFSVWGGDGHWHRALEDIAESWAAKLLSGDCEVAQRVQDADFDGWSADLLRGEAWNREFVSGTNGEDAARHTSSCAEVELGTDVVSDQAARRSSTTGRCLRPSK
jgi:hypothetical protein